jgi:uncharacterized membrane protein
MQAITIAAVFLACLLAGGAFGFFYAWSVTVMRGLTAGDPVSAIVSMNAVNATIMTGWFAILFFGAPIASAAAALLAWLGGNMATAIWMAAAALIYLAGCFAVTVIVNVPMNDALAQVDPRAIADPGRAWRDYAGPWTSWNHFRTAACGLALLAALGGLWQAPR